MRVRLLQARGWHVVSIPFYEWKQCGNKAAGQQAYLRSKLPPQLLEVGPLAHAHAMQHCC